MTSSKRNPTLTRFPLTPAWTLTLSPPTPGQRVGTRSAARPVALVRKHIELIINELINKEAFQHFSNSVCRHPYFKVCQCKKAWNHWDVYTLHCSKEMTLFSVKTCMYTVILYADKHKFTCLVFFFSVCVCACAHLPGRRQVLWECVEKDSQATVPADLCDPALEPTNREEDCNTQPCPA